MEEYDVIHIQVLAPSEYINDSYEEVKLSDELANVENELREWLRNRSRGTDLAFKVVVLEGFGPE